MYVYLNFYKNFFQLYKNFFYPSNIKTFFVLLNIKKINLSFDELKLIAELRNISDYENKSKEDLIKALSKTKPEPKPQIPKQK